MRRLLVQALHQILDAVPILLDGRKEGLKEEGRRGKATVSSNSNKLK